MDITSLSMALATTHVQNDVSTAVMSMGLDDFQEMGAEMTKMMEQSVAPELGQNIDVRV
ncbi:MAG: YjfB family protein [Lachnospiraceae bacterium]|nr:YjfB family protein [Lachnospiraceae bacterium]